MPRPTNKTDLIDAAQREHQKLDDFLETLTSAQMEYTSSGIEHWGPKDILAHVTVWEQMCLGWYRVGLSGENPAVPAEGYNWREIPALNAEIYQQHREESLDTVRQAYHESYEEMMRTIESIDEEEMFTPERFPWTRKNAMGTYFVSATSSHYAWAKKEIRKRLREMASLDVAP